MELHLDSINCVKLFLRSSLVLAVGISGAGLLSLRNLIESTRAATEAKEEVKQFTSIRVAVVTELHDYLKRFPVEEGMLNTDTTTPLQRAHLEEMDHLTFLAHPLFRFREPGTQKEVELYSRILLTTVRWHLSEKRYADGLARLDLLFKMREGYTAEKNYSLRARAHSYRAYAFIGLLDEIEMDRIVNNPERRSIIKSYRTAIEESLSKTKELDPSWSLAYIWEGLYHSLHPPSSEGNEREQQRAYRLAQESAIDIYRKVVKAGSSLRPDYSFTALLNICCCLKRIGDTTGDYKPLFSELAKIPPQSELVKTFSRQSFSDTAKAALWRKIMADDTFFAKVSKFKRADYTESWRTLLRTKVNVAGALAFYASRVKQKPSMQSWEVRLWEPN